MSEKRNPNRRAALASALPEAYRQLLGMNKLVEDAAADVGLDPKLVELIKIRASQLNGCAFCLDMHSRDARAKAGEDERRLYVLPAWRETTFFSEQEQAALALTEAMTNLPGHHDVPDEIYDRAAEAFTAQQLTVVVWLASVINMFNRFGVTSRMPLPSRP